MVERETIFCKNIMKSPFLCALLKLTATFLAGIVCFILGKMLFLVVNSGIYHDLSGANILAIITHGMSMDCSMSGYLAILPAILLWISIFVGSRGIIDKLLQGYYILVSLLLGAIVLLDAVLYSYWQFKLDMTPIFYFTSSPSAAFASAEWWMYVAGPLGWLVVAAIFHIIFYYPVLKWIPEVVVEKRFKKRMFSFLGMIVAAALLVIPIRGGVTVSTMNLSRAYYSNDQRLNHAAVNPAFSLMYSLSHQDNFSSQFRFMPEEEALARFEELNGKVAVSSPGVEDSDSIPPLIARGERPDIYILILESFSSHLFPSLGGEAVATGLDSIAASGLLFDNFYANSFRTDRGLVSIISGYPAQPTTSLMKYVSKTEHLPSLSKKMRDEGGYATTYYYGGDANFTNMRAYLVNAGFDRIICDNDFPIEKRLSKWGAHDEEVLRLAASEMRPYNAGKPQLKVIQTSSSHEPFEVPYDDHGRFSDKRAKAFAYTDSCVTSFVNSMKMSEAWDNTLVVIVPDHYGAYPDLEDAIMRHKIPLIMSGGALRRHGRESVPGSQIDIAATILAALGLPHQEFTFSKNLADPRLPHYAYFADPARIGLITSSDSVVYNLESGRMESKGGDRLLPYAKSYLQILYNNLSGL